MKMSILIADMNTAYRFHIKTLISQIQADIEVLDCGSCVETFKCLNTRNDIGLVMLDARLSAEPIGEFVKRMRSLAPQIAVVVAGDNERVDNLSEMFNASPSACIQGFIPKNASPAVIQGAIQLVLAGEIFIPRIHMREVLQYSEPTDELESGALSLLSLHLTPRQKEVLHLIVEGHRNKEICKKLNMSMGTIKSHCNSIFRFLNVNNRTQAASAARRMQLI